jgi:hypothetical protein
MHPFANTVWLPIRARFRVSGCALLTVVLACLSGCGESRRPSGSVSGKVILEGQPLDEGQVVFYDADGVPVGAAKLTSSGEFRLDQPIPVGNYQVAVVPAEGEPPAGLEDAARFEAIKKVPEQYWSQTTSGLTAEVNEGDNSFTFELG